MTVEVRDNAEASMFQVFVDGEAAGRAEYRREDGNVVFTHTVVDPGHEGEGLGGKLARGALDLVRADGGKVVPSCPFIKGWIDKHEDYQDLLAG
jgi:predicted GNAT family acetyltransferase